MLNASVSRTDETDDILLGSLPKAPKKVAKKVAKKVFWTDLD